LNVWCAHYPLSPTGAVYSSAVVLCGTV
jgi:hypothetical protein